MINLNTWVDFDRFDEYKISPLTVKALTAAGYVQMTRVQEATLSACLNGASLLKLQYLCPQKKLG